RRNRLDCPADANGTKSSARSGICRAGLHQQIENTEALLPVLGRRVFQIAINDLEGARERHAQPAHDRRQLLLGILAISEGKRRLYGGLFENGRYLALL